MSPSGAPAQSTSTGVHVYHPRQARLGASAGPDELAQEVRAAAADLGFTRIGFVAIDAFDEARGALERWLGAGYHGTMRYLENAERRADPSGLLDGARTLISVALAYPEGPRLVKLRRNGEDNPLVGRIARYARGADYHMVLKTKLARLAERLADLVQRPVFGRACVDTAPLLEREAAVRSGFAFGAKNTMAIVPGAGSYVLLGELLVDVAIAAGTEQLGPRCGSCRACLDVCPTGALVDGHVLDARKCISYLTIEHTGSIPRELRALIGSWVFGCDLCQEVCPFNASPAPRPTAPELEPRPELEAPELVTLLELGSAAFRKLVRRSALRRASRAQLARNAAVALGNSGDLRAVPPLVRALDRDRRPVVRAHVAWALGRLGGELAISALGRAKTSDQDPGVRDEASLALDELAGRTQTAPE